MNKKANGRLSTRLIIGKLVLSFSILLLVALTGTCDKGVSVKVDGKSFDENILKKENPELYQSIRRDYDERLLDALREIAENHMLALLAKEEGLEGGEAAYMEWLQAQIPEPTEAEGRHYYDTYRQQNPTQKVPPFETIFESVKGILRNERLEKILAENLREAKKKYNYEIFSDPAEKPVEIDIVGAPTRGNPDAKVQIVEFSGFECPYCQRVQATLKKLREEIYPNKIHWIYKDYPLRTDVLDSHTAGRCLYLQKPETFWNFFDGLYSKPGKSHLAATELRKTVAGYGDIDQNEYEKCLNNTEIKDYILKAHSAGVSLGVNGIPAFFINGKLLSGAQPIEAFQERIEDALN